MKKYYTGVGSRKTPKDVQEIMTQIATELERRGYILRSGHADGADLAFEQGVLNSDNMNIYLPYDGFNGGYQSNNGYCFIESDLNNQDYNNAYQSLIHHPRGFALSESAKNMMCRNYFQVHGLINEPKSEFNICWTENGKLVGGTAQSIRLCKIENIPIFNLATMNINQSASDIVGYIIDITSYNQQYSEPVLKSLF